MRQRRLATALATAVALIALAPGPAAAAGDLDRQQEKLVRILGAFELQLSRAALDTIGPNVNRVLINIANHPKLKTRVRTRAVAGIGLYPSDPSWKFLNSTIHEPTYRGSVFGANLRRQALRSLGKAFGDRAVDEILSQQESTEPLIREAVAHALGDTMSVRALPALRAWLHREPDLSVRLAVDGAIEKLRRLEE